MTLEQLRPQIIRLRKAEARLAATRSAEAAAALEYTAARQEMDDAIVAAFTGVH